MNILNKFMKKKRSVSFALAILIAGMSIAPSVPGTMTAYAKLNDGQQQGQTPTTNPDGTIPHGNKQKDIFDTARVYVNNTPLRLEVSKIKTQVGEHEGFAPKENPAEEKDTITYKLSGRIEGSITQLIQTYGEDNIELAYNQNGAYLGYGWKRGTLEYLNYRNEHANEFGDQYVDIIYNEYGIFSGYAHITRKLETADDVNRYVAGATMTLYDAIEIFRMPDYDKDDRFAGVTVERNSNGDVTNVYVNKGYAGTKVEYVKEETDESKISVDDNWVKRDDNYTYQDEINEKGEATWIAKTIQREDTPILYYSLSDLHITSNDTYKSNATENEKEIDKIFGNERPDKERNLYGFDKEGNVVNITQMDQYDFSIYVFEDGNTTPVFEIVGGDLTKVKYNALSKTITVGEDTLIYHLDKDGNRDSLTDPQTGIAYIEEKVENPEETVNGEDTRIYVWPVNIFKDKTGSKTFEKIKTNRIATINADTADEYIVGTYTGNDFEKSVNPTLDKHGMPIYYQKSDETYVKGSDRYDRDGDYIGYAYTDELDNDNLNAYIVKDHDNLYNGDKDDPFDQSTHYQYSTKQKIVVTVDIDGNYIVNGKDVMPIPEREGYIFNGWLVQPSNLKDGATVRASWKKTGEMEQSQKDNYYSDREATGNTRTITVEFDANGGLFTGSGDIHSSDNKLYFRQGESFLIENTWVTGENTPNDPFDEQVVNAIFQTQNTANDPYSTTNNGGMADMLKRISAGHYIMEEIDAPAGYVKSLPVGITVNEHDKVQNAEMVDTTIKIQIVKVDSTDSYVYNIYENGNLLTEPSGEPITYKEQTGSFSYVNVPGAILALKAVKENQKVYNDWINATNHPDIEKVNDNGNWYIKFKSDKPIYLENFPKGKYELTEVITPPGFVTAEKQTIEVNETTELITYVMKDDHTKVEIKKYYNDGEGNTIMPNQYSAGLELKAEDGSIVASWNTDDVTDFTRVIDKNGNKTGFTYNYENAIKANPNTNAISWDVERTATKRTENETTETWLVSDGSKVVIENGLIPDTAPKGFKEAYDSRNMDSELDEFKYTITLNATKTKGNDLSSQIWTLEDGRQVKTCAYRSNGTEQGYQGYLFEYKFNYKDDYTGIYENTVSYDTLDGHHRFDYLPVGTYILHEAKVPDGFIQADDKVIIVKETEDIQLFDMENVRKELIIAKTAMDDKEQFFAGEINGDIVTGEIGIVIPGAKLELYKVDAFKEEYKESFVNGEIPENAVLTDQWITGTDGVYTEEDYEKELIPKGNKVGDLKPHKIIDIENGYYYLIEKETPDYYRTAEPIEITVSDTTTASNLTKINVINKEMTGKVVVHKVNDEGSDLTGATFLVKNKTTGEDVGTLTTQNGFGELTISDIGTFTNTGELIPYTFTIQETNPPAGYEINPEIHEFTFNPKDHTGSAIMINEKDANIVDGILTVTDSETSITISKTNYDNGNGVAGATLKVSEAEFKNNEWVKTSITKDDWEWTTTENYSHVMTGLIGGKVYILEELKAPSGYNKAPDMFFKVSSDGKRIEKIWYDKTENPYVQFETDNTGAISSVKFTTRELISNEVVLIDTESGIKKDLGTTTGGLVLTEDDVVDGKVYTIKVISKYSDGSTVVRETLSFEADLETGSMIVDTSYATHATVEVTDHNENEIASFDSDGTTKVINNNLIEDTQAIRVTGNGKNHEAIDPSNNHNSVVYRITVEKAGSKVEWIPDEQMTVNRTEPEAELVNGVYQWTTTEDDQEIVLATILNENAVGYVNQTVSINEKVYTYMNPVAFGYGEGLFRDTSKLVLSNEIKGTDPSNDAYEFTYQITLTDVNNNPLPGSYSYRTKTKPNGLFEAQTLDGQQHKSFEVTLKGNDYLVVNNLPAGTKYSVALRDPSDDGFIVQNTKPDGTTIKRECSNILFTNTRNINEDRETFKKNTSYTITEKTHLIDKTTFDSAKYGFTIGENCEVIAFDMKDKPTDITINKVGVNENGIVGAVLRLYDSKANVIETWTTDGTSHQLLAKLNPGETYTLQEIKSAPGHAYARNITFTVSDDGAKDNVTMVDKETLVKVLKTDENGNGLSGARLQILDADKNPVKARITDETFEAGKDMIFTSTVAGTVIKGQLDANTTYFVRELAAPNGYYKLSDDVSFTTNRDEVVEIVEVENKPILLDISKQDITTAKELPGATLSIIDKETETIIETWISEETPHRVPITKLVAGKTYILHEEAAPNGYHYTQDIEFIIPENAPVKPDGTIDIVKVEMKDEKTEIPFTKSDITTGEELPGAKMQVIDKGTGKVVEEWISTKEPHVITGKLDANKVYILHEEAAPNGYYYSEDIEFTVPKYKDDNFKVEMKDAPIIAEITKTDLTTGKEIPGARLQIIDKETNKLLTEWISDSTPHIIDQTIINKLVAGKTYILHEEAAPNGFYYSEDIEFTVPLKDQGIIKVEMKDAPTQYEFSKSDVTTGKEVEGALMILRNSHGDEIERWISTKEPHKIVGKLVAGQTYYLYEESAPDGYHYATTIEFKVPLKPEFDEEGNMIFIKVTMEDYPTTYEFLKVDNDTKAPIEGATLQVIDVETQTVIDEWISTTEPHVIRGKLVVGREYILREKIAPNGYYYTDDMHFTVPKYNEKHEPIKISMNDKKTEVSITKSDITTGEELEGAKLQIKDKNGTVVEEWISTKEPHIIKGKLNAGETYILHEESSPDGYIYTEDIEFKVPLKDEGILKVEMKDKPTYVEFKKTDLTTEEELPGAHIEIRDESGKVVEEWISTDKEHVIEGKLVVDKVYIMHEEKAPDGYGYAFDIKFKVDRDNIIWIYNESTKEWEKAKESTVEMIDDVLKLEVIKVEAGTDTMIGGAVLKILDSNGTEMERWTTVENEKHVIIKEFANGEKLKADEVYTLVEESAPEDYEKAPNQTFQLNRDASLKIIKMEDKKRDTEKPWTPPDIEFNEITFDKYNGSYNPNGTTTVTNSQKLAGAEYTIYKSDGSVYKVITTGANGSVTIPLPPAGTYFLKETKAPTGFMRDPNTYSFTVKSNDTVSGVLGIVNYERPEVIISKKDAETKELLPGATFKIADSKGNVVFTGTTEKNGQLVFSPEYPDTFTLIETDAPDGYKLNTTYIKFTVAENGTVSGTTTMYNEKEDKKIGSISAYYESDFEKKLNGIDYPNKNKEFGIDRYGNIVLPKSGDTFNIVLIGMAWLASISFIGYVIYKKKKHNHKDNKK